MNTTRSARGLYVATLVLAGSTAALGVCNAVAAPRCAAPASSVDRRACELAQQSPEALRRFVARTQSIYHLYFWDYMTPEDIDRHHARRLAAEKDRENVAQAR